MRVLNIGGIKGDWVKEGFPEGTEIIALNANPEVADVVMNLESQEFLDWEPEERFDAIFASHVLEHLAIRHVLVTLKKCHDLLKNEGKLHILVPSLEWAAKMYVYERANLAVLMHIYGNQSDEWQFHKCGFTMSSLREFLALSGFLVVKADQAEYTIAIGDKQYQAVQLYVVGVRDDDWTGDTRQLAPTSGGADNDNEHPVGAE